MHPCCILQHLTQIKLFSSIDKQVKHCFSTAKAKDLISTRDTHTKAAMQIFFCII